jgi:hypothetical protein
MRQVIFDPECLQFLLDKGAPVLLIRAMQNTEIRLNIKKSFAAVNRAAGMNWCWPG